MSAWRTRHHASNNPKAFYKKRLTVEDVVNSRMICKPLHLLDCCVETDNANAIIVTTAERAKDLKHPLVRIRGVVGRCSKPRVDMHYQTGPISTVAGHYAKEILWPNSGVGPDDVDLTGSYDAFTFTTMLQLEDYGFCKKVTAAITSPMAPSCSAESGRTTRRRPSLRGLHPWHRHGDRECPPAPPRCRRQLSDRARRQAAAHP